MRRSRRNTGQPAAVWSTTREPQAAFDAGSQDLGMSA
jgi:hypothetical protein